VAGRRRPQPAAMAAQPRGQAQGSKAALFPLLSLSFYLSPLSSLYLYLSLSPPA